MRSGAAFAASAAAAALAHGFLDYWMQASDWANTKGKPSWDGRIACAKHVAVYTTGQTIAKIAAMRVSGYRPRTRSVIASAAITAVTHYVADRRSPLRAVARITGHKDFYAMGTPPVATGAHQLDQSWHQLCELVASMTIAHDARQR